MTQRIKLSKEDTAVFMALKAETIAASETLNMAIDCCRETLKGLNLTRNEHWYKLSRDHGFDLTTTWHTERNSETGLYDIVKDEEKTE